MTQSKILSYTMSFPVSYIDYVRDYKTSYYYFDRSLVKLMRDHGKLVSLNLFHCETHYPSVL